MQLKIPPLVFEEASPIPVVANALLYNDLLVPHDRPVRLPLAQWSREIQKLMTQFVHHSDLMIQCNAVMRSFNEAALIEVLLGRMNHAAALCDAAIAWTASMVHETEQPIVAKFALHPFINLARLARIHRDWNLALEKLHSLQTVLKGGEFSVTDIRIKETTWQRVFVEDPDFLKTIKTIYVVDILKTLLRAYRDRELLAFVKEFDVGVDISLLDFLREGAVIVLLRSGRYSAAMKLIEERLGDANRRVNRPVFLFRRAECYLLSNDLPRATDLVNKMASAFHDRSVPLGLTKLSFLLQLAKLMRRINLPEAISLSEIGFEAATVINDFIFQTEFLQIIKTAGFGNQSEKAGERMEEIRRSSLYGAVSDAALVQSQEFKFVDQLFHALIKMSQEHIASSVS